MDQNRIAIIKETLQHRIQMTSDAARTLAQACDALEGQIALVRILREENANLRQENENLRAQLLPPLVGSAPSESPSPGPQRGPRPRRKNGPADVPNSQ